MQPMRLPRMSLLLLLLRVLTLLLLAAACARGDTQHAPLAKDAIPEDLGPVQTVQGTPKGSAMYKDLALSYEDYNRVKMRPLLHLEPEEDKEASPKLLIFSAFLDTRPLYYNKPAVLRVMALKYEPEETKEPQVYCKYLVEGEDSYLVAKAHGPLRVNTNGDPSVTPYTDVIYTCATDITSIAMIEDAANRGQKVPRLPRFVTLVATPEQEVTYHYTWVHVSSVPLVHDNAPHVNQALIAAREPKDGPFLTPAQYKSGDGDVAVCVNPIFGGDYGAAAIAQWAEYQKIMGVKKVMLYDFQTGPLLRHFIQVYQAEGLFQVHDFIFSRRLLVPGSEKKEEFCHQRFSTEAKRHGLMSPEWVTGCAGRQDHFRVFVHAESAQRMHCLYATMGRYRWVGFYDIDEYLTPRLEPTVNYVDLFKQTMADAPTGYKRFGYQYNATLDPWKNEFDISKTPFPMAFHFFNTYVCSRCAGTHHVSPANATVDPKEVVTVVPPDPLLDPELRVPKASLHPVTWAAVRGEVMRPLDRIKAISDPLAVMTHYAHCPWTWWYMEGGSLPIPTSAGFQLSEDVALNYHVRMNTFNNPSALKKSMHPTKRNELFTLERCTNHFSCGSPVPWRYKHLFEDWTFANLFGQQLVDALNKKFHHGTLHGTAMEDRRRSLLEVKDNA